jgi:hypothetical protein
MEHAAGAAGGLYLEFAGQKRDRGAITLAVGVTELSATGVVLRAEDASGKLDGAGLEGREAIIRLPHTTEAELDQIQGRVLWTKPQAGKAGEYAIGLELANPDLRVRKTLEDRLQVYPKDIKELWDQWDRVHVRRLPLKADQAVYLVAAAAIGGGVGLFFLGPESLKLYGSILAVYGCMMMAVKSVWAMWQERTMSEE